MADNLSLDPDDWSEEDWTQRLERFRRRHPALDPLTVVAAINNGHVTLTPSGETVVISAEGEMIAECLMEIDRLMGGD